ncbi:hypothetical protein P0Y35_08345 [Kiritimatiellaeota bacterium B1221]|nr:hypothetical protein [Kiritimatiellaeota bacterium B1221]
MMNLIKHPGVLTIAYLLLRLILSPLSPVPGAAALDPLWIFALLLNRSAGKGWMFSLIPGLMFGDWMCGFTGGQIFFRLAGFVALGSLPLQGGMSRQYFLLITAHALWSSLIPDWLGHYPLGYLYLVWLLQGVLWWGIGVHPHEENGLKPLLPLLTVPAGVLILNLLLPSPPFWPIPLLGSQSGLALRILATFLLLPPFIGWFLHRGETKKAEPAIPSPVGGRWTHLAE